MNKEDILELYVIELQPKCWSICSTLSETKQIDTPRTLCFGFAEVYRNEVIADRHCDNIIKGGKFVNAKVVPLQYINKPTSSDLKKSISFMLSLFTGEQKRHPLFMENYNIIEQSLNDVQTTLAGGKQNA